MHLLNNLIRKSCWKNCFGLICKKVPKSSLEVDMGKKVKFDELIQY